MFSQIISETSNKTRISTFVRALSFSAPCSENNYLCGH